ncbi:hypothetical protein T265_12273 [Opisthorchis viverrini]|uniref:Uncharacterized protein n=1 Tax=Opisthorchis viverrini TaxID=6198 RepID=A0A074YZ09_OPIVI|nr:hypothetical protein T265_12273 [Opisthorchis viverrini]KER18442.1 hypothetical protein T265_12273 [Opisthorchis viverrini]
MLQQNSVIVDLNGGLVEGIVASSCVTEFYHVFELKTRPLLDFVPFQDSWPLGLYIPMKLAMSKLNMNDGGQRTSRAAILVRKLLDRSL